MNEALLYQDGFNQMFKRPEDFLDFLHHVERESQWKRISTQSLNLFSLENHSPITPGLALSQEIFEDTLKNTGLLVNLNGQMIPLRSCALKSLQDRAKISGAALRKIKSDKLSQIMNFCLEVTKGISLVRISAGKISALLSGDPGDYAVLNMADLFELTQDYLSKYYQGQFISGSFEHHLTTASWTIDNPQLVESYRQALIDYGQTPSKLLPAVCFSSSDVGISGANLYPQLFHNGYPIALGAPLKLEHKNGATVADFSTRLNMLFTHFEDSIRALVKLLDTPIDYPAQTMIQIAKRLNLPRKLAMQVITAHIEQTNNVPCSAHDCYYRLNEIVFLKQCQGASPSEIVHTSETIMRALTLKWSDYDSYSDIVW